MAGCHSLAEIKVLAKQPPKVGKDPLLSSRINSIILRVPIDTKKTYRGWAGIPYRNIKEFGSIVTVRNTVRAYGEANPKFGYSVRGEYFEGKPEITCEANEKSPVGKYDIRIDYGTITDKSIQLVGGVLTVDKATSRLAPTTLHAKKASQIQSSFSITEDLRTAKTSRHSPSVRQRLPLQPKPVLQANTTLSLVVARHRTTSSATRRANSPS